MKTIFCRLCTTNENYSLLDRCTCFNVQHYVRVKLFIYTNDLFAINVYIYKIYVCDVDSELTVQFAFYWQNLERCGRRFSTYSFQEFLFIPTMKT